jgi:hypothetical protein
VTGVASMWNSGTGTTDVCVRPALPAPPLPSARAFPSAVGPQICDSTLEEGRGGRREATHDAFEAIGTTLPEKVGGISRNASYP